LLVAWLAADMVADMVAESASDTLWTSMSLVATTTADGDPATVSGRRDAGATRGERIPMRHHIAPIDQHRRRDPFRRCRRIRVADSPAELARAIIGGGDHGGWRPRITRTNTTTTATTRRIWIKPPKVCEDTIPGDQTINSSIAMVSSNSISSPGLPHGHRAPSGL